MDSTLVKQHVRVYRNTWQMRTGSQCLPHAARRLMIERCSPQCGAIGSRRELAVSLATCCLLAGPHAAEAITCPSVPGRGAGISPPTLKRRVDPRLAAIFTQAVYETVKETKLMSEADFQAQNFKLRDREYKYYYEANQDRLDRVPDLSDSSGALSNPVYFNFIYYILWKQIARMTGPEQREQFGRIFGRRLTDLIAPGTLQSLQETGSSTSISQVQESIQQILSAIQSGGYAEKAQVVWGKASADLPYMWETAKDSEEITQLPLGDEAGLAKFQIRVRLPADIEGSVSLRQEEDGYWSQPIEHMVRAILAASGYSSCTVDELFFQDEWVPPPASKDRLRIFLGDPTVEVPWVPQTLLLNFSTQRN